MREHHENLSDLELIRIVESKDDVTEQAFKLCLDVIEDRNISKLKRVKYAKDFYREKTVKFYESRGFYSEKAQFYNSHYLSEEQRRNITFQVFEDFKSLFKDLPLDHYS